MNIAFIPIDNRPVCYTLPYKISKINDEISLFLPDREWLGGLKKSCDIEKILLWIESLSNIDAVILSLDTIAYGGLIPSRRSTESFDEIEKRLERLKKSLTGKKVYAFSSIMRISNNNINDEEKEYWKDYGKKIFEFSYNLHKNDSYETDVPVDIMEDYMQTRKRNFDINKLYLKWQKEGLFDVLIFSKDDCAEYGLNVIEARELQKLGGRVKTGADEIPLSLLSRAITDFYDKKIKVAPVFSEPEYTNLISNYEDIPIEKSVEGQLELAGCEIVNENDADVILYVNNFKNNQGEIVMKVSTEEYAKTWIEPEKPYIIADVRYANGADNSFVKQILSRGFSKKFLGYSAWNTSANTLGSLICSMIVSLIKKDEVEFKKLQITRFLDDWAYQANVRQMLNKPDITKCSELMKPFEDNIFNIFDIKYNIEYKFPWNRLFEVEIEL